MATLAVPGVLLVLTRVPLPGVDLAVFDRIVRSLDRPNLSSFASIGALALLPFASAFGVVEVLALVFPFSRRLRLSGPAGRAKLNRAGWALGVVLALVQGTIIASSLQGMSDNAIPVVSGGGSAFVISTAFLLAVGVLMNALAAAMSSERGLISGFSASLATLLVLDLVRNVRGWLDEDAGQQQPETSAPLRIGMLIFAGIATWILLSGRSRAGSPIRGGMRVPNLASGIVPLQAIASAVQMIMSWSRMGIELPDALDPQRLVPGSVYYLVVELVVASLAAVAFAWIFNAPGRVAGVFARAAGEPTPTPQRLITAHALTAGGAARSVVFFALVLLAPGLLIRGTGLNAEELLGAMVLVAVALDLRDAWVAHRAHPELVPVWPEPRPYAVRAGLDALAAAGIRGYARSRHHRTMLQIFGALVSTDIMVPEADRARATEILHHVLGS